MMCVRVILCVFLGAILACAITCRCQGIEFVALNREKIYEFEGTVNVIAQAPWDQINSQPQQMAAWTIRGTVKLQRTQNNALAASVRHKIVYKIRSSISKGNKSSIIIVQGNCLHLKQLIITN